MKIVLSGAVVLGLALAAVGLIACTRDEEAELGETATPASPTAGGLMPFAVVSLTPAMMWGGIAGTLPAASATAKPTAAPTATTSATASISTLTPDERAEAEALLKAASLRPEDIPEGFPLVFDLFTSNEELMELKEFLAGELGSFAGLTQDDLDHWGRILGYLVSYGLEEQPSDPASFSGTDSFQSTVDLFRDARGAGEYLV